MKHIERQTSAGSKVFVRLTQARELIVGGYVVEKRAVGNDDEGELLPDLKRSHVAVGHGYTLPDIVRERGDLAAESGEHAAMGVERMD